MLSALQNEYVMADILKINYFHRKAMVNGFKFQEEKDYTFFMCISAAFKLEKNTHFTGTQMATHIQI